MSSKIIKLGNNVTTYFPVTNAKCIQVSYTSYNSSNNNDTSLEDVLGYMMNRINNIPTLPETPAWNPYMPFYTVYHIKFANNGQYYEGYEQTFRSALTDINPEWQDKPNTSGLIDAIISGSYYDVTKSTYTDLLALNDNATSGDEPPILDESYFNMTHGLDELVGKMIS